MAGETNTPQLGSTTPVSSLGTQETDEPPPVPPEPLALL
jgi:hypothetical protein